MSNLAHQIGGVVTQVLVHTLLYVNRIIRHAFLKDNVLPTLASAMPTKGNNTSDDHVMLHRIPALSSVTRVLRVNIANDVSAVLSSLYHFLMVDTTYRALMTFPTTIRHARRVYHVINGKIFRANMLARIDNSHSRQGIVILLLHFLNVSKLTVPATTTPTIPKGQDLRTRTIVNVLYRLEFAMTKFRGRLYRQRTNGSTDDFLIHDGRQASLYRYLYF